MNKDVIYIAPEDDITDIISKLKAASQKIVAIVPPQSVGILRSAVNIKLISKTAEEAGKVPVLVSSDPTLLKLAADARIPVTENLQTPPTIPTEEDLESRTPTPEKEAEIAEDFVKPPKTAEEAIGANDSEEKDEEKSDDDKKAKDSEKDDGKSKTKSKFLRKIYDKFPWVEKNRKILAVALVVLLLLTGFCIWAFVFAPAVDISVNIRSSNGNFSEQATFTTNKAEEDVASGKFYLNEEKVETESKVEFTATGKKDLGNKASGSINVSVYFDVSLDSGSVTIPSNTAFTYGGLKYLSTSDLTIKWSSSTIDACENSGDTLDISRKGCKITGAVPVSAAEPGSNYNLDSGKRDWSVDLKGTGVKSISTENTQAISGGTSRVVTVVQQSDVDTARSKFTEVNTTEGASQLYEKISDTVIIIKDTYKSEVADPVISPKVGEEVPEGTTPTISSKATFSVYTVDAFSVEAFISVKATLGSDQEIYSLGDPYIERFNGSGSSYTGKIKTTYKTGPKITEDEIRTKVAGRKVGEVQSLLKSINGVDTVSVKSSFFWVNKVPEDQSKINITIKIDGEDYNGFNVNSSKSDGTETSDTENTEEKTN